MSKHNTIVTQAAVTVTDCLCYLLQSIYQTTSLTYLVVEDKVKDEPQNANLCAFMSLVTSVDILSRFVVLCQAGLSESADAVRPDIAQLLKEALDRCEELVSRYRIDQANLDRAVDELLQFSATTNAIAMSIMSRLMEKCSVGSGEDKDLSLN